MPHCHSVELRFINLSSTESENFSLSLIPVSTGVLSVSTLVSNATVHTISNTAVFRQKVVGRLSSRRRGMEPLVSSFSRIPSKYMQLCIDRPVELLAKPLLTVQYRYYKPTALTNCLTKLYVPAKSIIKPRQ